MKSLAVALLVLLVPAIAHAGHHCHEASDIVGYERCSSFGMWSFGFAMSVEVGAAMVRYSPKLVDATVTESRADGTSAQYHVTAAPGDPQSVSARGGRLRMYFGLGRRMYLGAETTFAPITSGPHLVADIAEHGAMTTMDTGTRGWLAQNVFFLGYHTRRGPVTLAGEIGPGVRFAAYSTTNLPDTVSPPMQAWLEVEAHPKVDFWVTPNISLGVEGSLDLLHADSFSAAVLLGGHLFPYDAAR